MVGDDSELETAIYGRETEGGGGSVSVEGSQPHAILLHGPPSPGARADRGENQSAHAGGSQGWIGVDVAERTRRRKSGMKVVETMLASPITVANSFFGLDAWVDVVS